MTDRERELARLRKRRERAAVGGRTDADLAAKALERRLASWARHTHHHEVAGLPRHRNAAWVRRHYPDMVDQTRQTLDL